MLDTLRRDVGYAVRVLLRGRVFTVVAVVTLALGIGANSAIFTLVNGLLLRPLPYPEVDRLVWIASPLITSENLAEWRDGLRSLERVGVFGVRSSVLTNRGPAERLGGMAVSRELLPLLGAAPVQGRLWSADELRPGGPPTVVLSHRLWDRLGGEIGVNTLTLNGESFTVIGVLPAGFEDLHYRSDVWYPAESLTGQRFNIIGLRRPDVSLSNAQAEARALAERVEVPGAAAARRFVNVNAVQEIYTADLRTPLLVLFAAAGLVLLIACANVANLLLSRAAGREREMAVRAALGAQRIVLFRQLLTESAVLALAGALAGWFVATAGLRIALAIVPESYAFGRVDGVRMDRAVLLFTAVVAFATTLLAGLAPAIHAVKRAARAAAGFTRAGSTRGATRAREALMAAEIAIALVLLIGTLLLVRTFLVLRPAAPGFDAGARMVASMRLPADPPRDHAAEAEFARRVLQDVQLAAPAARVAIATHVPLSGFVMNFGITEVDGQPLPASGDRPNSLDLVAATPNYFDVLGMNVVRGRGLAPSDVPGSANVALINETGARRFWPGADPIGRRIALDLGDRSVEFTVIGIAADIRTSGNNTTSRVSAFVSFWQVPWGGFDLVVHQPQGDVVTGDMVRGIVAAIDPGVPISSITMLEQMLGRAVAEPRYHMTLMVLFAALAVVLALVGCYGVLGYSVAQRTHEIGVRVALGASRGAIVRVVLLRGAGLIAIGLFAGLALAFGLTRVLQSSLYGVAPTDLATFAASAAALALISVAAAYLPARRAARVQPVEALRAE